MTRHLLVVLILSVAATGCYVPTQGPNYDPAGPCDVILHPAMLAVPFDELVKGQKDETEGWILTEFPTATVHFESFGTIPYDFEIFSWMEGDKAFSLNLYSSSRFIFQKDLSESRPTLGHILRCYGDPDYYTLDLNVPAEYMMVTLDLWYPKLGVMFGTGMRKYPRVTSIDMNTDFIGATIVTPPGTVEEMYTNYQPFSEEFVEGRLTLTRKWPEDFTEFVLEDYAEDGENADTSRTESPLVEPTVTPLSD